MCGTATKTNGGSTQTRGSATTGTESSSTGGSRLANQGDGGDWYVDDLFTKVSRHALTWR